MTSRYLSSAEVASALGVTKTTLKNWLRQGRIPEPLRNPSNNYRVWTPEDLTELRRGMKGDRVGDRR